MAGGNKKQIVGNVTQGSSRGSAMKSALQSVLRESDVNSVEMGKAKQPLTKKAIGR